MRADILIVRLLPFIIFVLYGITLTYAWCGIVPLWLKHLHCDSLLYAFSLFVISLSNQRYHCKWNRAMYVEAMIVPIINFADARWGLFDEPVSMLITMSVIWSVTLILTAYLAIRHYIVPRIKKNGRI